MKIKRVVHYIALVLILISSSNCSGQDAAVEIYNYPFVNYNLNKVQFFNDSIDFYGFFRKLDKLIQTGKGKLNVVHFGGSHIQADVWSGQMRENFNQFINQKTAARGWVYPFKLGFTRNNNPHNYEFKYSGKWDGCRGVFASCSGNLGMNAIKTTTYDSSAGFTFTLTPTGNTDYVFDRIKVFYDIHHQSYEIGLDSPYFASQVYTNKAGGYTEFVFEKPMKEVSFRLMKTDSLQNVFTLFGMYTDLDAPGINYNAIGANGASVPTYLKCNLLEQQLNAIQPDLIVFSVGINDAFDPNFCQTCFENNYRQWLDIIRRAAPNAAILFTTNTDSYKRGRKNRYYQNVTGLEVKSAMQKLSHEYNTGVWDIFSIMGGLGSMEFWYRQHMAARDRVHLTGTGYRLLGDLMFNAFIKKYEDYLTLPIARIKHDD